MKNLPSDKATAKEISVDIMKNSQFRISELTKCANKAFKENKFIHTLKLSDILKKLYSINKTNFRPVRFLPLLSKLFEKICIINFMNIRRHF